MVLLFLALFFMHVNCCANYPKIEKMSLREKIAQMIFVPAVVSRDLNEKFMKIVPYDTSEGYPLECVKKLKIGGILFLGASNIEEQVGLTNTLQKESEIPLLIFQDAEWGPSMRIAKKVTTFPKAMTLGALSESNDELISQLGEEIGKQLQELGVHSPLAPVLDVNDNPHNPIIGSRSFGENPDLAKLKSSTFAQGLNNGKVLTCCKHFPGHGNSSSDSHEDLPLVPFNQKQLEKCELIPFDHAIKKWDPDMIMTAHLDLEAVNGKKGIPATLSKKIITDILRGQMGFKKLIITDGLGMKGVTKSYTQEQIAVKALQAGCDILLCPIEVEKAINGIMHAVQKNEISEKQIDRSVSRIFQAKHKANIVSELKIDRDFFTRPEATELKRKLYLQAITLVKNSRKILPISPKAKKKVITIGNNSSPFITALQKNGNNSIALPLSASQSELKNAFKKQTSKKDSTLIISLHLEGRSEMIEMQDNSQIKNSKPDYVEYINKYGKDAVFVLFGSPYNLDHFKSLTTALVAYENEPEAQQAAANTILGKHNPSGYLPVTGSSEYPFGTSLSYDQN